MGDILWNYTGAVGPTKATPAAKIGYQYGAVRSSPKLYTIEYNGSTFRLYINGVEVDSSTRPAAGMTSFGEIIIAADYDDMAYFKGIIPEMVWFNNTMTQAERQAYENYLADKWLPNGEVLNGHTVTDTAVKPTITSAAAFLELNETGLVTNASNRVTAWNDSSTVGTARVATPFNALLPATKTVKGKRSIYFDNKSFLRIPAAAGADNNPDYLTAFIILEFDDFDRNSLGDTDQTIVGAKNNAAVRWKKYDADNHISFRLGDYDGAYLTNFADKAYITSYQMWQGNLGYLSLYLGTDPGTLAQVGPTKVVNNASDFGVGKFPLTGLIPNTQYYGKFLFSRLANGTSDPHFDLARSSSQFEFYNNLLQVSKNQTTNNYEIARTNRPMNGNTGTYYFEAVMDFIAEGSVVYIGLADTSLPSTTAAGLIGWSISSHGRKYAKQTGGGTTWGGSGSQFTTGDVVGILYNADTGTVTMYKNGTLVGIAHNALVNVPVEAFIGIDKSATVSFRFPTTEWTNPNKLPEWKSLPYVTEVLDESTSFKFKTLPQGPSSFKIIGGSCNRTGSNAPTFDAIVAEDPNLFIHLGDFHYEDVNSVNPQDYAEAMDLAMSEKIKMTLRAGAWEYRYDNHDSLKPTPNKNDANWVYFIDYFLKSHVYHPPASTTPLDDGIYYSYKMGRVLIINTELRRNRDPQNSPESPTKSLLGTKQKTWLKQVLLDSKNDSDIQCILWASTLLWTADRNDPLGDSLDSWGASWGSYETERAEIANFIYENQVKNIFFLCGDTHMQAIDDGRNSCYITDNEGNRVDPNTIDKAYWMPMLEASPFDQYIDIEGGPFATSDLEYSGGPVPSYEQSYGIIEVLDKGENWIQVKIATKALIAGEWKRNQYYTWNFTTEGTPGTPPPLDWTDEDGEPNPNGYIAVNSEWKELTQRSIAVDGQWKPQLMKFKFIGGEWKKIYDSVLFNPNMPVSIHQLNSWTVERLNWVLIQGKGFLSVSYPIPYGGFWELERNVGDIWDNYPNLVPTGVINFEVTDNVRHVVFGDNSSYLTAPSAVGSGAFFNNFYDSDFFIGIWVYVPSTGLPVANEDVNLISNIANNQKIAIKQTTEGNVILSVALGPLATREFPAMPLLKGAWNKVALNVKNDGTGNYTHAIVNNVWSPALTGFEVNNLGSAETTPVPIIIGEPGPGTFRPKLTNFYFSPRYNGENQVTRYMVKPQVDIVLKPKDGSDEYIIPNEWRSRTQAETTSFTIPPAAPLGKVDLVLRALNIESNPLPMEIIPTTTRSTPFSTNFETRQDLDDNFFLMHKAWGGANGGVVAENVEIRDGKLWLYGNGDLYEGSIQGVTRDGDPKFHTHEADPRLGQPWTNRVGACVVYKEKTGFGSYRVKAKIPTELGQCSAFWTFFYNEIYPEDPRYPEYIAEGLHEQGNLADGYYITRNHEIDIELPSHLDGGILAEPSFNNMKCNTWRGELQNWDVPFGHPEYWEEYRDNLTPTGVDMYNGQEREFRFDWYKDRVEFYIDGVLKRTNTNVPYVTVPDIPGHFTFGVWFPSSPLPSKPWLVRPDRAWAGGTVDADGGRKAMFDRVVMEVSEFTFTPFDQTGLRLEAETYPFGGYRLKTWDFQG